MASGGGPPQRNHGDMGDTFAATGARAGTARPKLGADASVAGSQARTPGGGGASGGGRAAGAWC